jgi:hypothetical protein
VRRRVRAGQAVANTDLAGTGTEEAKMADSVIRIGCDFSDPAIENSALLARGFTFCGRYIGVNPALGTKRLMLGEAKLRTEAGLDLFSSYEGTNGQGALNGYQQGVTDGNDALAGAREVHQPPGTPIYFNADWDVQPDQFDNIQAYLAGAASVVAPTYTVGLYSSYDALTAMAERGAAEFFWQSESTSFSNGRNATQNPNDDLWQHWDDDQTFPCPASAGPPPCIDDDDAFQAFFGQWRAPIITTDLIMAWRGHDSDESIYWTTFDGRTWQPEQKVPVPGSSAGPALALLDGQLGMAFKGTGVDQDLWYTTFIGSVWGGMPIPLPFNGSSGNPALALFHGQLFIAFPGPASDQSLYWSSLNGTTWAPEQKIPEASSGASPTLAAFGNQLYMAWRGEESDQSIYWTTFDGATWAPEQKVPGVGTAASPALAVFNNQLYMAWRGEQSDESVWWTTFNGATWAPQQKVPGVSSAANPALAVFYDPYRLYMTGRGGGSDESIWWTTFEPSAWSSSPGKVPGASSAAGPALLAP